LNIVKSKRKKLKLTQKSLSIKCETKQSYISQIENYKKMPGSKLLLKISNNLKLCPLVILQEYLCKNCEIKEECDIQIIIIKK